MSLKPEELQGASGDTILLLKEMEKQELLLKEQNKLLKHMRNSMRISAFFNFFRILLFIVPVILAIIYLPSIIRESLAQFNEAKSDFQQLSLPQGFDFSQLQQYLER